MTLDESNHMNPCQKCGGDCKNPIPECPDYGRKTFTAYPFKSVLPPALTRRKYDLMVVDAGMGEHDYMLIKGGGYLCTTDEKEKGLLLIAALKALDNQKEMQESMKHG